MVRKGVIACAIALCVFLGVVGCGDPGGAAGVQPGGQTRVVIDIEDTSVNVPVHPQRVVTLSEPTLDGVLALGITPIGTVSGRGQSTVPNYLADRAGTIPILGSVAQPNFEAIGKVKPDLILVDGTSINNNPPVIEALRAIAPTVYAGYAGGDWRTTFSYVADALNKVDEGKKVIADYDRHVAEISQQIRKNPANDINNETFSIVRWQGASAALILKELPPGMALEDLGLKRPPNQDRLGLGHSEPVSRENLRDIDADWIFFGTLGGSSVGNPNAGGGADLADAEAALAEAEAAPGFTSLKAYQQDHIVLVDGSVWTSTGGPLLMDQLVDDVGKALGG